MGLEQDSCAQTFMSLAYFPRRLLPPHPPHWNENRK